MTADIAILLIWAAVVVVIVLTAYRMIERCDVEPESETPPIHFNCRCNDGLAAKMAESISNCRPYSVSFVRDILIKTGAVFGKECAETATRFILDYSTSHGVSALDTLRQLDKLTEAESQDAPFFYVPETVFSTEPKEKPMADYTGTIRIELDEEAKEADQGSGCFEIFADHYKARWESERTVRLEAEAELAKMTENRDFWRDKITSLDTNKAYKVDYFLGGLNESCEVETTDAKIISIDSWDLQEELESFKLINTGHEEEIEFLKSRIRGFEGMVDADRFATDQQNERLDAAQLASALKDVTIAGYKASADGGQKAVRLLKEKIDNLQAERDNLKEELGILRFCQPVSSTMLERLKEMLRQLCAHNDLPFHITDYEMYFDGRVAATIEQERPQVIGPDVTDTWEITI